jgi:hypothetical protein
MTTAPRPAPTLALTANAVNARMPEIAAMDLAHAPLLLLSVLTHLSTDGAVHLPDTVLLPFLAHEAGTSIPAVRGHLAHLEQTGWITVALRPGPPAPSAPGRAS